MTMKGFARARNYKIPRLHLSPKEKRIKEEKETRSNRYKTLTPQEKQIYEIIREYGVAQMQAIGRGQTIDEAIYAKKISELYE